MCWLVFLSLVGVRLRKVLSSLSWWPLLIWWRGSVVVGLGVALLWVWVSKCVGLWCFGCLVLVWLLLCVVMLLRGALLGLVCLRAL